MCVCVCVCVRRVTRTGKTKKIEKRGEAARRPLVDGPVTVISILITGDIQVHTLLAQTHTPAECHAVMKVDASETGNSLSNL